MRERERERLILIGKFENRAILKIVVNARSHI